jgi:hypothetical protein
MRVVSCQRNLSKKLFMSLTSPTPPPPPPSTPPSAVAQLALAGHAQRHAAQRSQGYLCARGRLQAIVPPPHVSFTKEATCAVHSAPKHCVVAGIFLTDVTVERFLSAVDHPITSCNSQRGLHLLLVPGRSLQYWRPRLAGSWTFSYANSYASKRRQSTTPPI